MIIAAIINFKQCAKRISFTRGDHMWKLSILNIETVDAISVDLMGNAVLAISDELSWENEHKHLLALQSKINAYLEFIENGNLYEQYLNAARRNIIINVVNKYEPNKNAVEFYSIVKQILKNSGYGFTHKVLKPGS